METIKVRFFQFTGTLLAVILTACAGNIESVRVTNTLPGQQKVMKATVKKNYDTVQGKSLSYLFNGSTQTAPNGGITNSGGNISTYSYAVPGSGAWQPDQTLDYTWTFDFNRAGSKTKSGTFTVPGVPDLRIPVPGISFSVGGANVGNPSSNDPNDWPEISAGQNFTVKVRVLNQVSTVMNEPFVVKLNVFNETSGQLLEASEKTQQGIPQGQEISILFGYQFDEAATLIFSAKVDSNEELPETIENNNDSLGFYRVRIVP